MRTQPSGQVGKKTFEDVSLAEFREMIGVERDKYPAFGALNKHVLKPALLEINALAPFNLTVLPIKAGKKVARLRIGWWNKNKDEMNAAWQELHRSKVGRRARITGHVDYMQVHDALPGQNRILRYDRVASHHKRENGSQ